MNKDKKSVSKRSKAATKEYELNESEKKRLQVITKIREKYYCNQHQVPCLITEMGHNQLSTAQLIMWSNDIVRIMITFHLFQSYD